MVLRKDPQTINTSLAGFLFIVPIERNEEGGKGNSIYSLATGETTPTSVLLPSKGIYQGLDEFRAKEIEERGRKMVCS